MDNVKKTSKKRRKGQFNGTPGPGRPKGSRNKATVELQEAASAYTVEALATLRSIMINGESETARVSAACALLDRGHGKPRQQIDMNVDTPQFVVGVERLMPEAEFDKKYLSKPNAPSGGLN